MLEKFSFNCNKENFQNKIRLYFISVEIRQWFSSKGIKTIQALRAEVESSKVKRHFKYLVLFLFSDKCINIQNQKQKKFKTFIDKYSKE